MAGADNRTAIVVLAAGAAAAWWLLDRQRAATGFSGGGPGFGSSFSPNAPGAGPRAPGAAQSLVGGCASGATAGAAGGPIGSGVGCAVGFVGSGIANLGWFRGGEEGVQVNPARDAFQLQFASLDANVPGANGSGFYGLHWLLVNLDRTRGQVLFDALQRSDTMTAYNAAVRDIQAFLDANKAQAQYLAAGRPGYDDQIRALYRQYYNTEPDAATLQAHRGNPWGAAGVEALLRKSLGLSYDASKV
jgi:hypothetical protein